MKRIKQESELGILPNIGVKKLKTQTELKTKLKTNINFISLISFIILNQNGSLLPEEKEEMALNNNLLLAFYLTLIVQNLSFLWQNIQKLETEKLKITTQNVQKISEFIDTEN